MSTDFNRDHTWTNPAVDFFEIGEVYWAIKAFGFGKFIVEKVVLDREYCKNACNLRDLSIAIANKCVFYTQEDAERKLLELSNRYLGAMKLYSSYTNVIHLSAAVIENNVTISKNM